VLVCQKKNKVIKDNGAIKKKPKVRWCVLFSKIFFDRESLGLIFHAWKVAKSAEEAKNTDWDEEEEEEEEKKKTISRKKKAEEEVKKKKKSTDSEKEKKRRGDHGEKDETVDDDGDDDDDEEELVVYEGSELYMHEVFKARHPAAALPKKQCEPMSPELLAAIMESMLRCMAAGDGYRAKSSGPQLLGTPEQARAFVDKYRTNVARVIRDMKLEDWAEFPMTYDPSLY